MTTTLLCVTKRRTGPGYFEVWADVDHNGKKNAIETLALTSGGYGLGIHSVRRVFPMRNGSEQVSSHRSPRSVQRRIEAELIAAGVKL